MFASIIVCCCCTIVSSTPTSLPTVIVSRKLCIKALLWLICASAVARILVISSLADVTACCGAVLIVSTCASRPVRFPSSATRYSWIFLLVLGPSVPSCSSPTIPCAARTSLLASAIERLESAASILVAWDSNGCIRTSIAWALLLIISNCSSIAGWIRLYAVSIRCCSLSICNCISLLLFPMLESASAILCWALLTISCCLRSSWSFLSICATPSLALAVCSICAFDRKPKIPILVMNISIMTAALK